MKNFSEEITLFSDSELEQLHEATLDILADPGMRILTPALRDALERRGAQVDHTRQTVQFSRALVEETIAGMQADLASGHKPQLLNGVTISKSSCPIQAKFGGACIEYFDWDQQAFRTPTRQDLIDLVRLGQALSDVTTVGNPVVYLTEEDGSPVDPRLQRVKTAALIALYTMFNLPYVIWMMRSYFQGVPRELEESAMVDVKIGVSMTASNLTETAKAYQEASIALIVGEIFQGEEMSVMRYERLGLGRLIYQLPITLCELFLREVFEPGTYEALDPVTMGTINKFFENNLNGSETSRQLFVHRNTLVYRLDKVEKITGLDLRNFEDAVLFKLADMVRDYLAYVEDQKAKRQ